MALPYYDLLERRCGEISLEPARMLEMTPRTFQNYYEGATQRALDDKKEAWQMVRWVCYYAASGNLKKGVKAESLLTFPWENSEEKEAKAEEKNLEAQAAEVRQFWERVDKKRSGNK